VTAARIRSAAVFAFVAVLLALAWLPRPSLAAAARDWTRTVALAPGGGIVIGNPAARTRVIEYASYTCGHCAHVSESTVRPLLDKYVRSGKVVFEFRNAVRDRYDMVAALLARCGPLGGFMARNEAIFVAQADWVERAQEADGGGFAGLNLASAEERAATIANGSGLEALLAARGVPAARQQACLADPAIRAAVTANTTDAFQAKAIRGTPFFYVNDKAVDGYSLPALERGIAAAMRP